MRVDRCWIVLLGAMSSLAAAEMPLRHEAPIGVTRPAPFIALALPVEAYARSQRPDLADLRVVDAQGERVPFALLGFRDAAVEAREQAAPVAMYALPKAGAGRALPEGVDVVVQRDRIELRQRRAGAPAADAASAGWLFDLGERKSTDALPHTLRLHWTGPAEFSVGAVLETSDDLRGWRRAGGGQLMALRGLEGGALTQPRLPLPGAGRFVRLTWTDAAKAPKVDAVSALSDTPTAVARDAPLRLTLRASAEPAGKVAAEPRALHLDLGGVLPVSGLDLNLPPGTAVLPLRVQQRNRADDPWQTVAQAVVYRIERDGGAVDRSPPLRLQTRARYLRLLPDERAPAFDSARTEAIVELRPATLVFAAQGRAPYRLWVGSVDAAPGGLTPEALVPALDDERPRFGAATLGAFAERPEAAAAAQRADMLALWRPRALWAVLLAGVAGLGWMVWRLARGAPAKETPQPLA